MVTTTKDAIDAKRFIDNYFETPDLNGLKIGTGIKRVDDGFYVRINLRDRLPESIDPPLQYHGVPLIYHVMGKLYISG